MYEKFYGLSAMPFQLTPDARFFYEAKGHNRANAHLHYGLAQGEGFIVITGEVGTGKTTLVERLLTEPDCQRYNVARVSTTQVSGDDLLRLAMAGFGIQEEGIGKAALLRRFEAVLQQANDAGRRCLLIVDEVQNLPTAALEELRMLSNLAGGERGVLQTLLVGQPQFRAILARPDLDQLRQRVLASYHLGPMTAAETRAYVEHRMRAVGWKDNPHWEDGAFAAIYAYTGGVPRRINRLCSRVLLYGALDESPVINGPMVETTGDELQQDLEAGADMATTKAPLPVSGQSDDLAHRVEALEHAMARREQVFQRLSTILGSTR